MTGLDTLLLPDPTSSAFARLVQHAFPFLQAGLAAGLVLATRAGLRVPARGWIVFAGSAVVAIAAEAIVTEDASASSQLLLFFPLLFAATQLRPTAAHVVTAMTIAVHVLEVILLLPPGDAARDALYGALAYGAVGILITHGAAAQHRLTEVLRQQATIDSLTGLVTRRVLDEAAHGAIVGSLGHEGVALLVLDIDEFKIVNDTYGHPAGDAALVHVAAILAEHARADDVVARIGGDELTVLMMGVQYEVALRRAQELVTAVRSRPLELADGRQIPLTVSIGVAQAPTHTSDLSGLYAAADAGLYEAKHHGRDRVGGPPWPHGTAVMRPTKS